MYYQVTDEETRSAKNAHHIYNLNIILTHLAISQVALEIGGGNPFHFLLVPLISISVLLYIRFHGQKLTQTKGWFVGAHWMLAWRRGRILIMAYIAASFIMVLASLLGNLLGGGLMMNDFSADDTSTPIHEKITMFLSAVLAFAAVLLTFIQTGLSVYEAGRGVIDSHIERYLPRDTTSNKELGMNANDCSQPLDTIKKSYKATTRAGETPPPKKFKAKTRDEFFPSTEIEKEKDA